ncbi:hypothetical protein L1987_61112 [Smallanthus sonchifolius]|uniref:Uncharacterized protein n=1 Tax=Smallanthus sonchifolius TaxID=185202 RepID=A0ACB9DAK3_9ASTR|nr:hypothetical protein L1987_61112 [Smallanthus sonchifolius]
MGKVNERYMVANNGIGWNRQWKRPLVIAAELDELQRCQDVICQITLTNLEYSWGWDGDSQGIVKAKNKVIETSQVSFFNT